MAFTSFTISQAFLGAPLQFYPVLGSLELEELIDAFVTGSSSKQEKISEVTLDFFNNATVDLNTGALVRHYNVYPTHINTSTWSPTQSNSSGFSPVIYTPSPSATDNMVDSGYGSFSSSSAQSTPPVRNFNNLNSAASSAVATGRVAKKGKKSSEMRLPGFSIMTKDGVDVTNSAGRGTKTKEQREHAHLMRIMKACEACKKKKVRCDPSHRRSQTDMSRTTSSSTSSTHQSGSARSNSSSGTSSSLSTPPAAAEPTPAPAPQSFSHINAMDDFVLFPEDVSSWDLFTPSPNTHANAHANTDPYANPSLSDWDYSMGNFDFDILGGIANHGGFDVNANVDGGSAMFQDSVFDIVGPLDGNTELFFHSQSQLGVSPHSQLQSQVRSQLQSQRHNQSSQEDVSWDDGLISQRPAIEPSDDPQILQQRSQFQQGPSSARQQQQRQQRLPSPSSEVIQQQQLQQSSSLTTVLQQQPRVNPSRVQAQEDECSHQLRSQPSQCSSPSSSSHQPLSQRVPSESRHIATTLMDWTLTSRRRNVLATATADTQVARSLSSSLAQASDENLKSEGENANANTDGVDVNANASSRGRLSSDDNHGHDQILEQQTSQARILTESNVHLSSDSDQDQSQDQDQQMGANQQVGVESGSGLKQPGSTLFSSMAASLSGLANASAGSGFSVSSVVFCLVGLVFLMTPSTTFQQMTRSTSLMLPSWLGSSLWEVPRGITTDTAATSLIRLILAAFFIAGTFDNVIVCKAKAFMALCLVVLDGGSFFSSVSSSVSSSTSSSGSASSGFSMKNHLPSTSLYTKSKNSRSSANACTSIANLLVPDLGSGIQTPWIFSLLREFSSDADDFESDFESRSEDGDGDGDVIMMD